MKTTNKIEINDILRNRLLTLEASKNLNHTSVADELGISRSQYSVIFRSKSSQKYVSKDLLEKLADFYNCTLDYIIGTSNIHNEYADHTIKTRRPVNESLKHELMKRVTSKLREDNNHNFLRNLDFILCNLPDQERNNIINGFNATIDILRTKSIYSAIGRLSSDTVDIIISSLQDNDTDYCNYLKIYHEAIESKKNRRYKKALCEFLSILKLNQMFYKKIIDLSFNEIEKLLDEPNFHFPKDIKNILPELYAYRNNKIYKLEKSTIIIIENYLENNKNVK